MAAASSSSIQDLNIKLPSGPDKYRGAVVEDLQLPPAFALDRDEVLGKAIQLAYDRDFSYIPVLSKERKPLGYVDVSALKAKWEANQANPDDSIMSHIIKFKRGKKNPYTVITPWTDLYELEEFLKANSFAIISDPERKFVIGVATADDLNNFVSRRGF